MHRTRTLIVAIACAFIISRVIGELVIVPSWNETEPAKRYWKRYLQPRQQKNSSSRHPSGNNPYQQHRNSSYRHPSGNNHYQQHRNSSYRHPSGNNPYQQHRNSSYRYPSGNNRYQQHRNSSYRYPSGNNRYQQHRNSSYRRQRVRNPIPHVINPDDIGNRINPYAQYMNSSYGNPNRLYPYPKNGSDSFDFNSLDEHHPDQVGYFPDDVANNQFADTPGVAGDVEGFDEKEFGAARHEFHWNRREFNDKLLYRMRAKMDGAFLRRVTKVVHFPGLAKVAKKGITYVKVLDLLKSDSHVELISGGPGTGDVVLRLKSARSKGFDFIISIYGFF